MKAKHLSVSKDTAILVLLRSEVKKKLKINDNLVIKHLLKKSIIYGLVTVILYSLLFTTRSMVGFIFCYVFFGIITVLLTFNFAHDFSHNAIFKSKKKNQTGFWFLFTLAGAHSKSWGERHVSSHHFAPNVMGYDTDLAISKLIRVIPESQFLWFHKYQYLYASILYSIYSLYWVFVKDFVLLLSVKRKFKYHLDYWFQKIVYVLYMVIIPMVFSAQSYNMVILGFLVMHLVQSVFLLFTFFITHHVVSSVYPKVNNESIIQSSWVMNQVNSSNDFHPFSSVANFIFGGFNSHIAHHLFPNIPHCYHTELNKIIYMVLRKNNIEPNFTTFFGGVKSHLLHLKNMGYK